MITTRIFEATGGKREAHVTITVDDPMLPFIGQLCEVLRQYEEVKDSLGYNMRPLFRRWFLSDSANQQALLPDGGECATSVVEQPPLDLTKVALWVWLVQDVVVARDADGIYSVEAFGHTHLFETGIIRPGLSPREAMASMLSDTDRALVNRGGSLLGNCVRTWLFVRNVDLDYAEVVKGRNEAFQALGLTPATRFIASTGIGGRQADPSVAVAFDSYSILGLEEGRMQQISAPSHLNPTYDYGVAFERATSVDYDDRRHLFVSGTASIDNKGNIVWPGDIMRQTLRMIDNVRVLLETDSFDWDDVGQMLVYLRDPADYEVVSNIFEEWFGGSPFLILLAPVCRPGWLVEMECMAMKKA